MPLRKEFYFEGDDGEDFDYQLNQSNVVHGICTVYSFQYTMHYYTMELAIVSSYITTYI